MGNTAIGSFHHEGLAPVDLFQPLPPGCYSHVGFCQEMLSVRGGSSGQIQCSKPKCVKGFEIHALDPGLLSLDGQLSLPRYETGFSADKFCIDRALASEDLNILMCDICSQIPCVQMCCPHGEAFLTTDPENPYYGKKSCQKKNNRFNATFHDQTGEPITSWERNEHYRLVAPKEGQFVCPVEHMSNLSKHWKGIFTRLDNFADSKLNEDFKIFNDGSLKGIMPDNEYDENYEIIGEEKFLEVQYKPHEFCVEESELESEDSSTKFDFQLFVCKYPDGSYKDRHADCEALMIKLHSSTLIISIVFLIITLIIYLIEPSLKKQYLSSRITIAIIVNMTAAFIVTVHIKLMKDPEHLDMNQHLETPGCIAAGYFKQYFFLALFCWLHVMTFNIYRKFSKMFAQRQNSSQQRQEAIRFLRYSAFAQGVPLLLVILTAVVDSQAPEGHGKENDEKRKHYPNMGIYNCFLGIGRTCETPYFFETPTFIYFTVWVLISELLNVFYIGYIVNKIHETFEHQEQMRKDQEKGNCVAVWKEEFKVLFQLFSVTGIWWIFDIISGAVGHTDYGGTCTIQIFLDLPNLLAGVLIFLATVTKKSVAAGLKEISGLSKSEISETSSSLNTKDTNLASTSM